MLVIVDYGVGNLASIKNMLKKIGAEAEISNNMEKLDRADKLILPGVGAFDSCVQKLEQSGLRNLLEEKVLVKKTPVLGICVGMQLLLDDSEEGKLPGLGWIKGRNVKFDALRMPEGYRIPHMGWSEVSPVKKSRLLEPLYPEARFYFVHSYHAFLQDQENALLLTEFGYSFTAAVEKENILGVQFHPEKSHKFGMQLLENFVKNY